MKTTQRLFATTILTVVLAAPVLAGDILMPSLTPAPPPPPSGGRVASTPVDDPSTSETACAYDLITETALLFCQKMLALL